MRSLIIGMLILPGVVSLAATAAGAQNLQNWLNNETARVQQGLSSGLINSNQASSLAAREAQIQAQQQQYMTQNGGTLTAAENRQIARELRGMNRHFNNDVRSNNPAYANGFMGAPNGYAGNYMGMPNPAYPQGAQLQGYGYPPVCGPGQQNPYLYSSGQQNPFGYHHRHHRWNQMNPSL